MNLFLLFRNKSSSTPSTTPGYSTVISTGTASGSSRAFKLPSMNNRGSVAERSKVSNSGPTVVSSNPALGHQC